MNYMPSEMVTVPKIAKSSPNTPTAKLAYITPEEQNILIDLNLYGSLDGKPNRGPGGIPSLEGDFGSPTGSTYSGGSAGDDGGSFTPSSPPPGSPDYNRTARTIRPKLPPGVTSGSSDIKTKKDEKRAREEVKKFLKSTGQKSPNFFENLITNRKKTAYNLARKLPGATASSFRNLKDYRNYLVSQGADTSTIDELIKGVDEDTPINYENFQELLNLQPSGITDKEVLKKALEATEFTNMPVTAVPQTFEEFMLTQKNNPNLFAAGNVGNFMDMRRPKDLVNPFTGELYTDIEFENLKREIGQDRGLDRGDGPQPLDPCKGPNPPAYCFIGQNADDNMEAAVTRNLSGLTPRIGGSSFDFTQFAADGGRIGFANGAQFTSGGNISPGTDVKGNVREDNPFTGGGGDGGPKGPPSVINPPKTNPIVERLKKRNLPGDSPFKKFLAHDKFVDQLKARRGQNYHELGGLDFMARFPNINPEVAKMLASGYQNVFELGRAIADGPGGKTIADALDTAKEEARLNAVGIDAFFDPTSSLYQKYADMVPESGAVQMAGGGIASLDREAFLLGGLAKGLKKATRAVKKIAKSPIGKAALIAGGGYLLGGGIIPGVSGKFIPFAKYGSSAGSGFGFGNILPNILNIAKMPGLAEKAFSMGTTGKALTGILGASLLSGLMTKKQDDDEFDLASYYAQNQLTPSQSVRGMGSEFDFYGGQFVADGGRIGYQEGSKEPVAKKTLPLIDMDGMEKDYRETGGFVEMGRMEKADDVPARLSKNEFVFTADAVRNAGDGDIDKGAEVMYNMMKNLEAGGEVSEESQGLEGARNMFQTSQRLGEVI